MAIVVTLRLEEAAPTIGSKPRSATRLGGDDGNRPQADPGATALRVIAGTARGRRLIAPEGRTTRPITDRAKESIFNMIESRAGVAGAVVVDLFAGSGSFGIESLSRGAAHVTFVERDRRALAALTANLETLGFADRATVRRGDVNAVVAGLGPVDIAFCDPPYADDPWSHLLGSLDAELLVGHADHEILLADRWEELTRRRYGRAHVLLASPKATTERLPTTTV